MFAERDRKEATDRSGTVEVETKAAATPSTAVDQQKTIGGVVGFYIKS